MLTIRLPLLLTKDGQFKCPELYIENDFQIPLTLLNDFKLKSSDYYLSKCSENVFQVKLRLLGGKGGFGSQLRAQGNKMSSKKRAGNYESCRSLNGQRLRVQKQTKMNIWPRNLKDFPKGNKKFGKRCKNILRLLIKRSCLVIRTT